VGAAAAVLAAAVAAAPASAQFQVRPMRLPAGRFDDMLVGPLGAAGNDVLFASPVSGTTPLVRPWRNLLAGGPPSRAVFTGYDWPALGRLRADSAAGGPVDVAWLEGVTVYVDFGGSPGTLVPFPTAVGPPVVSISTARLLPRAEALVVAPVGTGTGATPGRIRAVDVSGAAPEEVEWPTSVLLSRPLFPDQLYPVRLSPAARAAGVDDLVLPMKAAFEVLWHTGPPRGTLAELPATTITFPVGNHAAPAPNPWLPPGTGLGDLHGAAGMDVDGDAVPDLVFPLSGYTSPRLDPPRGVLFWVRNTEDPATFAAPPFRVLTDHPDLQPLTDPVLLWPARLPVEGGGFADGFVLWDRVEDAILAVTPGASPGRLRVWRAPALGLTVKDAWVADVVGSPAPDLVALAFLWDDVDFPTELLVFPDVGDPAPALAWPPGGPGPARRGEDLDVRVIAEDASPLRIEWYRATGPTGTPVQAGPSDVLPVPGADLCDPAAPVELFVRAIETDLGVFTDLPGTVAVAVTPPALRFAAPFAPPLALPPGGAALALEGDAWEGCGRPVSFTWGGNLPPEATVETTASANATRAVVALPEVAYPGLLAGTPEVTLQAVDDAGLASPVATVALPLDASGLAVLAQDADRTRLAPGEVAVIRTRVESRLGVPLPGARIALALDGLAPAGAPRATGAAVAGVAAGGSEIVLDALPAAGTAVLVEVPVRALADGGAASAEVRSSGGWLLTAPARSLREGLDLPGCACGLGARPGALAVALALLALAPRRRRVT
jgi:hypothetical protein